MQTEVFIQFGALSILLRQVNPSRIVASSGTWFTFLENNNKEAVTEHMEVVMLCLVF